MRIRWREKKETEGDRDEEGKRVEGRERKAPLGRK